MRTSVRERQRGTLPVAAVASPLGGPVCPLLSHGRVCRLAETLSGRDQGGPPVTSEEWALPRHVAPRLRPWSPHSSHPSLLAHPPRKLLVSRIRVQHSTKYANPVKDVVLRERIVLRGAQRRELASGGRVRGRTWSETSRRANPRAGSRSFVFTRLRLGPSLRGDGCRQGQDGTSQPEAEGAARKPSHEPDVPWPDPVPGPRSS